MSLIYDRIGEAKRLIDEAKVRAGQTMEKLVISPPIWARPAPRTPLAAYLRQIGEPLRYKAERALQWSDELTPPLELRCGVGMYPDPRIYRKVADDICQFYIDTFGLRSNDDVLDMGCGCGQIAVPLTRFLNRQGSYSGFDVNPGLIDWCRDNITPRYPNFHFWTANVYNSSFNPTGTLSPAEYRFPYKDESFDFIIAKSLFTHLLVAESENYVAEAARVLRPGGRFCMSVFLLTEDATELIAAGKSTLNIVHPLDACKVMDAAHPEAAVGFRAETVEGWFQKSGLRILSKSLGSWCGRTEFSGYQDEYLLTRA